MKPSLAQGGSPPPGREEDLRTILGLLDENRVVTLTASRGLGRTMLLETVADLYGVPCWRGRSPSRIERGDLVVLDDAQRLGRRALQGLVRKVVLAEGRVLLGTYSQSSAPRRSALFRLGSLPGALARAVIEARRGIPEPLVTGIMSRCAGHPALLRRAGRWVGRTRGRPQLSRLDKILASEVEGAYLEGLGAAARREAGLLVAAGGWLPDALNLRGFTTGVSALVEAGFAERLDGAVLASPLLMVAQWPRIAESRRRTVLQQLQRSKELSPSRVPLCMAHLCAGLGQEASALENLRAALRAARGALAQPSFHQSLEQLVLRCVNSSDGLANAATLAAAVLGFAEQRDAKAARKQVASLLAPASLEPEEQHEAATFLGYLEIEAGHFESAARTLEANAQTALEASDAYGEVYALLWAAWARIMCDELQDADRLAQRASRIAKGAGLSRLELRALHVRARVESMEGEREAAIRHLRSALTLSRRHRLDDDQLIVLDALAEASSQLGRPSEAAGWLDAADGILAKGHPSRRRGNLAMTRAALALRRGHVRTASRLLASSAAAATSMPWNRDLLEAECCLASGDSEGAAGALRRGALHPGHSRAWLRRRAVVAGVLLREGFRPGIDLEALRQDSVAALILFRGEGEFERAGALLDELEQRIPEDDPGAVLPLRSEAVALRLLQGRMQEAASNVTLLRDRLASEAASTGAMLLLDGVTDLIRGLGFEAARKAVRAHRVALRLGQGRLAHFALELLATAHLALGRERGLGGVLKRLQQFGEKSHSKVRLERLSALSLARTIQRGEAPPKELIAQIESSQQAFLEGQRGVDPIALAVSRRLLGEKVEGPLAKLAEALSALVAGPGTPVTLAGVSAPSAEVTIDRDARQVTLAGGRVVFFARRHVLWRLLLQLCDASGQVLSPGALYKEAWLLPFNASRLNSLYVGVRRLRMLIEPDPSAPRVILAAPDGGYVMDSSRVQLQTAAFQTKASSNRKKSPPPAKAENGTPR